MSARTEIKDALVTQLKLINGNSPYLSNLHTNVVNKLIYWDQVPDYPYVCVTTKRETREYLPGDFKWGILNIPIWIFLKGDGSDDELEKVFSDIETIVDANQELEYTTGKFTEEIRILSLTSDEGLMDPLRIGEILLQVRYGIDG